VAASALDPTTSGKGSPTQQAQETRPSLCPNEFCALIIDVNFNSGEGEGGKGKGVVASESVKLTPGSHHYSWKALGWRDLKSKAFQEYRDWEAKRQ
jgi:hypothetical protein